MFVEVFIGIGDCYKVVIDVNKNVSGWNKLLKKIIKQDIDLWSKILDYWYK